MSQCERKPVCGILSDVQDNLIHQFVTHAKLSPHKIAIITSDTQLTYHELYLDVLFWKERLAPYLHQRAIVCLERTPRLISILLALQWLKVTYIPVDSSIPIERLYAIVEDSQPETFLYDLKSYPDYAHLNCHVLNVTEVEQNDPTSAHALKEPNPITYIIYTSGSTGKPKGVAILEKAVSNFLQSMCRYFLKEADELLLAITTITFDISVLELFLPLWAGKTVFLTNEKERNDPLLLLRLLKDYPVTLLQAVPSMWKLLVSLDWNFNSRVIALCGGEALSSTLSENLSPRVKQLWNMYGPTEATVWCALKEIHANEPITIGRPIDNTEMCVMDESFHILPPNVKGELFIGGLCLAEGYVNNEALTEKQFIEGFYRVGDIACRTEDDEFIIFGRTDHQIKLHGFRIELEEIEALIKTLPNIRECAVSLYHEQLIAYISLNTTEAFKESEWIARLSQYLPTYMLPHRVVLLDKLPLSGSGKIARNELLPPPLQTLKKKDETLSETELCCRNIWSQELGIETIGLHDDFFELGGHSLIAMRIILKIFEETHKKINLADFYQNATIARLSHLVKYSKESEPLLQNDIEMIPDGEWLPLNDFQVLLWFYTLERPTFKKFNSAERKRLKGTFNEELLEKALQFVFETQEVLSYTVSAFFPAQKKGVFSAPGWEKMSLREYDDHTCEVYLAKSLDTLCYQKLWSSHAPMMCAKLFYLKNDEIELQVGISHLISDEASLHIFFKDLLDVYDRYAENIPFDHKNVSHPFIEAVLKENALATSYRLSDALFWDDYLKGTNYCFFPQKYRVKNAHRKSSSFSSYFEIPEEVLTEIHAFCTYHHITMNELFSAAVGLSLQKHAENLKKSQFVINMIRSTRHSQHYDHTIGAFINLYVVKVDLNHHQTLLDIAKQIQSSILKTMEYQRASVLVKFAAMGEKNKWKRCLIKLGNALFSKLFFNPELLKSCLTIFLLRPKRGFIINVNILNQFFTLKKNEANEEIFVKPNPPHPYKINVVDNVLDVCFHRNPDDNRPYVAITSNLTSDLRDAFGETLLKILMAFTGPGP